MSLGQVVLTTLSATLREEADWGTTWIFMAIQWTHDRSINYILLRCSTCVNSCLWILPRFCIPTQWTAMCWLGLMWRCWDGLARNDFMMDWLGMMWEWIVPFGNDVGMRGWIGWEVAMGWTKLVVRWCCIGWTWRFRWI